MKVVVELDCSLEKKLHIQWP